ncbi:TPA: class I SAM-dependent methyltransferase [Pseudomonas aeruginosa]|nr:class I SAM-dependent methyltransferase [Pseudomonas aeruginosa]EMC2522652.1 class I SAM-dependent methyltransferase [Pseudomonas aeruginosa]MBA5207866.1 class I SAM-dependent methyltransferase [Pseudomonas aeruginosa]MBG4574121.1 class I SAM-dependent methyltransferase [Pseudomonas aeruginosa]MBM9966619.1 class I SAM-dependent methyltransferase [Pseudomonas aeruginosa]MBN0096807.1 class I SAM-dependent methyltransferase [Pseudomonas aeruginosa]
MNMVSNKQKELGQFPTPAWVADALYRQHFSHLGANDLVLEPGCGPGQFLQVIPSHVPAIGIDIDPNMVERARVRTGREVLLGDFTKIDLDFQPTAVIGNPPFQMRLVDQLLDRCHQLLPDGGQVGFLLPAYALQTAATVVRYNTRWSMQQSMIPRNIYPGLSKPLAFVVFTRDLRRLLVGFSLYYEAALVNSLEPDLREELNEGHPSWVRLVETALTELGGSARLQDLYAAIVTRRPSENPAWKEQIRKICQQRHIRVGRGRYAKAGHAAMSAAA